MGQTLRHLKQGLADSPVVGLEQPPTHQAPPPKTTMVSSPPPKPSHDALDLSEALENLSSQKRKHPSTDDDQATLIRDYSDIEELLIEEDNSANTPIDPATETVIGQVFPDLENRLKSSKESDKIDESSGTNPFKSIIDPW